MEISYSVNLFDAEGNIMESGIFLFLEGTPAILKMRDIRELDDMIDELHDVRRRLRQKQLV